MIVKELYPGNYAVIETPAKINLFLEVLNKRPDNYHNINSLFQAISLYDRLELRVSDSPKTGLASVISDQFLDIDEDNLVSRAYRMMQQEFGLSKGLVMRLYKKIPIGAGLGGGSSDAAATILACNLLFDLGLSYDEMAQLGLKLGSDVPFFFSSGQAIVTGRGEIVQESSFPLDYQVLLVSSYKTIWTAASYAELKMDLTKTKTPFKLHNCGTVELFLDNLRLASNDFEKNQFEFFPELKRIKDVLLEQGAKIARMTGTGSTMFGVFTDLPERKVEEISNRGDWRLFTVEPIALKKQVNM